MLVTLTNPKLYDGGADNPSYPANVEVHHGTNNSLYVFVKDIKAAGVSPLRHCSFNSDNMKMAVYQDDFIKVR